jgi:hypothetical protein
MKKIIFAAIIAASLIGCKTTATTKTETKSEAKQEVKADERTDKKTAFDIKTIVSENKDIEIDILDDTFGEPDSTGKVHLTKSVKTKIVNKGKATTTTTNESKVNEVSKKEFKATERAKVSEKVSNKQSKMTASDYIFLGVLIIFAVLAFILYAKRFFTEK